MTTTVKRTTNRGMASFIQRLEPFQANSVHAAWLDYMPSTGRLPSEWAGDLRLTFERSRTVNGEGARMVYVVFSYGTPIAWYSDGEGWVEPPVKYSVTTSKQQGQIRGGFDWRNARTVLFGEVQPPPPQMLRKCVECGRVFDMFNETDADEFIFGHDCEVQS